MALDAVRVNNWTVLSSCEQQTGRGTNLSHWSRSAGKCLSAIDQSIAIPSSERMSYFLTG